MLQDKHVSHVDDPDANVGAKTRSNYHATRRHTSFASTNWVDYIDESPQL